MLPETQWWLAELDQHGNPELCDGMHSDRQGAEHALYLIQRLGLSRNRRFAVAEVRLTEAKPDPQGADEGALATLNAIGLRPTPHPDRPGTPAGMGRTPSRDPADGGEG